MTNSTSGGVGIELRDEADEGNVQFAGAGDGNEIGDKLVPVDNRVLQIAKHSGPFQSEAEFKGEGDVVPDDGVQLEDEFATGEDGYEPRPIDFRLEGECENFHEVLALKVLAALELPFDSRSAQGVQSI